MNIILDWVVGRLKEPSTYAGLSALIASFGLHFTDADVAAIVQVCMAVAGLAAVILKEKGM